MRRARSALLALAAVLACGRDAPRPPAALPQAVAPTVGPDGRLTCPHGGLWSLCAVRERLENAGLVPIAAADSVVRHDFLAVPGVAYALGPSQLEVFVYPDSASVAADLAEMDTVAVAHRGQRGAWPSAPTLIHSANLLAVLTRANERQIERVQLALTAGPPARDEPGKRQSR